VTSRSLREWRLEQLLSIRDLADRSGVAAKTILDVELGRRHPRLVTMKRLCDALQVGPREVTEFRAVLEQMQHQHPGR
jgi:transcriptional regulator with XRE-family HTH domain